MFMEAENYVKFDYQLHQDTQNDYPDCCVSAGRATGGRRARARGVIYCCVRTAGMSSNNLILVRDKRNIL